MKPSEHAIQVSSVAFIARCHLLKRMGILIGQEHARQLYRSPDNTIMTMKDTA